MKNLNVEIRAKNITNDNVNYTWLGYVTKNNEFDSWIMINVYNRFGTYQVTGFGKRVPKIVNESFEDKNIMIEYCNTLFNICIDIIEEGININ